MIDFTSPENQHPALKLFPLMPPDELQELADDIKANGQREEILLVSTDSGDLLVDGQNRAAACKLAGINPEFRNIGYHDGWRHGSEHSDLVGFVLSKNIKRRHLTPTQRAGIVISAADLVNKFQAEAKERQKAALAKANAERKAVVAAAKQMSELPEADMKALKKHLPPVPVPPGFRPTEHKAKQEAVVPEVQQPPKITRTNDKIAKLAQCSPSLVAKLMTVKQHAPELLPAIIANNISADEAESRAVNKAAEKKQQERAQKKAVAKPKPNRTHGIFEVGAILLGSEECGGDLCVKKFTAPLLFEVLDVRKTHATCREISGRSDKFSINSKADFRMEESCGEQDYRSTKILRVASVADKKMVDRAWAAISDWK